MLDRNKERSNLKQFLDKIPTFVIRIQSSFTFLFRFKLQSATDQEKHSSIWCCIFLFLYNLSWQYSRLVLRGIQISSWISSIVLLLKKVVWNLLSQSKLWSATFFFLRWEYPLYSFLHTKKEVIWNSFSTKYLRLLYEFKVLLLFCFVSNYSLPPTRKNTLQSGVVYFFFSITCLDNTLGWSLEEFKFRLEFLP